MVIPQKPTRYRKRIPLTPEICDFIRQLLNRGHFQHDIAADLGVNQGRISEINTGKRRKTNRQPSLFD